jgi:hypothetical protein
MLYWSCTQANPSHSQLCVNAQPPHLESADRLFDPGHRRKQHSKLYRLKAKPGENAGGSYIPGIRNYEYARTIMKGAKAGCLFRLGDTHAT